MSGLVAIVALYLYVNFALRIARKMATKRESKQWKFGVRVVVMLVFILIPTWDAILGRVYLNHLCSTEAGVKVYHTIELPAEYWDEKGEPKFFNEHGYLEHNFGVDKLDESGGHVERYSAVFAIDKDTSPVKERASQKLLAEVTTFLFLGGWVSRNFAPHNTASSCKFIKASDFSRDFYGQLFKPVTSARHG